jgi:hypothetical protein
MNTGSVTGPADALLPSGAAPAGANTPDPPVDMPSDVGIMKFEDYGSLFI